MTLITRKSQCIGSKRNLLVKSPKEAIRRTLKNYMIKDGFIVRAYGHAAMENEVILANRLCESLSMPAMAN